MTKEELEALVRDGRTIEAVVRLAEGPNLEDREVLDLVLTELLPRIVSRHAAWLISHPDLIDCLLDACKKAQEDEYRPAETIHFLTRLRCYKALHFASQQKTQEAQTQVLLAAGSEDKLPPFERSVEHPPTAEALSVFFTGLFEHLRVRGHGDAVQQLGRIVEQAIRQLAEDESRVGVVRGLFITSDRRGMVRLVLTELEEGEGIEYQHVGPQQLGSELEDAARAAHKTAHEYLQATGYPEGLSNQRAIWQIVRPDGIVEDLQTLYDGSSLGLALTISVLSSYLQQVIPADLAFTGALDIHSARTGEIMGVDGAAEKLVAAMGAGIQKVYLPQQNLAQLGLAIHKSLEGKVELRPVDTVPSVAVELLAREKPKGLWPILAEASRNVLGFLGLTRKADSITQSHVRHGLLTACLFSASFFLEGLTLHKVYALRSDAEGLLTVMAAAVIAFVALLASYSVTGPLMVRGDNRSWYFSILLLGVAVTLSGLLLSLLAPPEPLDTGPAYDWPPYLALFKDVLIYYVFGFFLITNLYYFVAANEFLLERRQFQTVRGCLTGNPKSLSLLPNTVLHIEFRWAVVVAFVAGMVLLLGELYYLYQLRQDIPQNAWIMGLGLTRDAVLTILAVEVLVWYQVSQIRLRAIL